MRKNWLPFVFGPALAIANEPISYWPAFGNSSANRYPARPAGAGRVAALAHEAVDDAVEDDAVVVVLRARNTKLLTVAGAFTASSAITIVPSTCSSSRCTAFGVDPHLGRLGELLTLGRGTIERRDGVAMAGHPTGSACRISGERDPSRCREILRDGGPRDEVGFEVSRGRRSRRCARAFGLRGGGERTVGRRRRRPPGDGACARAPHVAGRGSGPTAAGVVGVPQRGWS